MNQVRAVHAPDAGDSPELERDDERLNDAQRSPWSAVRRHDHLTQEQWPAWRASSLPDPPKDWAGGRPWLSSTTDTRSSFTRATRLGPVAWEISRTVPPPWSSATSRVARRRTASPPR